MDSLQQLLDASLSQIRAQCLLDGKFDSNLLDQHQQVCYDLALCVAEVHAARAMSDYTEKLADNGFAQILAQAFIAQVEHSVLARLTARREELGLSAATLQTAQVNSDVTPVSVAQLAAIGTTLQQESITELPSLLADDIDMVRQTFARFAEQIVMPLAEEIHRQDTDIPEVIIQKAAELGCFGTCIPQRFGGLQPDDRPDSLGMIVVTEQLSRGSLGAAGSLITRPEIAARALLSSGTEHKAATRADQTRVRRTTLCHLDHRTGYWFRRSRRVIAGDAHGGRLGTEWQQDLVYLRRAF